MLKDAECFTHIYLRTGRTDMRLGIDGLLTVIGGQMGLDSTEPGSVFLFCGRKKNRMKALIFEGDGWLLCYKLNISRQRHHQHVFELHLYAQ